MTQANQTISANFDKLHDTEKFTFRFKKDKLGNKRANVELEIPVPSVEGIIEILQNGGKGVELLKEAMADVIRGQLANHVAENEKVTQETIDLAKFEWDVIANLPKQDRRSVTIDDSQWEGFAVDYAETMGRVTTKSPENIQNAIKVYVAKFAMFKTDKKTLEALKGQLAIYMENTKSEDQFADILELLLRRLDNYLAADDVAALAAAL